jgi:hypothetical protein
MPVNYALSKIYKIVDLTTNECYVGSTCEPTLARRLSGHMRCFKRYQAGNYHYVTSFKILEGENYSIELVEAFPCNNKDELHAREGYWIRSIDCVNKVIVGRTPKEYCENNKEKLSEYKKEHYVKNKDKILEHIKEYYENNKDKIAQRAKKYYDQNKEKISKYRNKYYEQNNGKINKKCECLCGTSYMVKHKSRHCKSNKHQQFEIDYENFILSKDPSLDQLVEFINN